MNIGCYLITNGTLKDVVIPDKLLIELIKSLRATGKEIVHLTNESIEVEGVYIPAKGAKTAIIALPDIDE